METQDKEKLPDRDVRGASEYHEKGVEYRSEALEALSGVWRVAR